MPCSSAGEGDDNYQMIIDPCSVLSPEAIDDGQILGSWADRKVGLLIDMSGSLSLAQQESHLANMPGVLFPGVAKCISVL